jgi:hypothetical protein
VDSNVALLRLNANNIGGDLQAFQNLGGLEIANHTIKGNGGTLPVSHPVRLFAGHLYHALGKLPQPKLTHEFW